MTAGSLALVQFLGWCPTACYLIHNPVMGAGFQRRLPGAAHSASGELVALLAVLAFALATAFAFWWLIERTTRR